MSVIKKKKKVEGLSLILSQSLKPVLNVPNPDHFWHLAARSSRCEHRAHSWRMFWAGNGDVAESVDLDPVLIVSLLLSRPWPLLKQT